MSLPDDGAGPVGAAETPDDLRSLEETARFFDVSVPTVRTWIKDGCPVAEQGGNGRAYGLSLRAVADWRRGLAEAEAAEAERKRAADAQLGLELLGSGGMALQDAGAGAGMTPKQRAEWLRAEMDAAKLAVMRGELVRADDLRQAVADAFARCKARLRSMPDTLARNLGWDEAATLACLGQVDGALEDLANDLAGIARPAADADGPDHAAG